MGKTSTIRDKARILNLATGRPFQAEGRVRIDLTDPVTGRVKDRVEGKNHVFTESLLSRTNGGTDWWADITDMWLCLNDSNESIATDFPYLLGQTIGYGLPSKSGSGIFRGAYNAANQVLEQLSPTGIRWKFQYDFTTVQAIGTIRTIGLTRQYDRFSRRHFKHFKHQAAGISSYTNTGKYAYECSTAGIITKTDLWLATTETIDVSAVVGTVSGTTKQVGYAPATGRYYVYCYSNTAGNRYMYEFSDDTFSTLLQTYPTTNITLNLATRPLFVHGNIAYWFSADNTITYANYVSNTAQTVLPIGTDIYNNAQYNESGSANALTGRFYVGSLCIKGTIVGCFGFGTNISKGILFDLSTGQVVGFVYAGANYIFLHPLTTEKIACTADENLYHCAAISAYKLPSPVTKTSANGMTVAYELEVNWA